MFLLNVDNILAGNEKQLTEFPPNAIPDYAILSHRWAKDEVLFADIMLGNASTKESWGKVVGACEQAAKDNTGWIWIDTCCIDKSSSAELSEAINSMYVWYKNAKKCYAYLCDVPRDVDPLHFDSAFRHSEWWKRGWTLQELLAPAVLVFFSREWTEIGGKTTLRRTISSITGIDKEYVTGEQVPSKASIATRMSWATRRETTRPEDMAYCLMGLFAVNMPMLYGEGGEKAFLRLQEEIMKGSDDQSLFAWINSDAAREDRHGLLAKSPSNFVLPYPIVPYQDWEPRPPYSITNRGLQIELHLTKVTEDIYLAALDCPAPPDYQDSSFLAIYLRRLSAGDQYARVHAAHFTVIRERGALQAIYVRQNVERREVEGFFKHHIFQLRHGSYLPEYTVVDILRPSDEPETPRGIMSSRVQPHQWTPLPWPVNFWVPKESAQLAAMIIFKRDDDKYVAVMLGSTDGFKVGFHAIEIHEKAVLQKKMLFESMNKSFYLKSPGEIVYLEHHSVKIVVEPITYYSTRYYMVDVEITAMV